MSDQQKTDDVKRYASVVALLISALASAIADGDSIEVVTRFSPVEAGKALNQWCENLRIQGQSVTGTLLDHPFSLTIQHT